MKICVSIKDYWKYLLIGLVIIVLGPALCMCLKDTVLELVKVVHRKNPNNKRNSTHEDISIKNYIEEINTVMNYGNQDSNRLDSGRETNAIVTGTYRNPHFEANNSQRILRKTSIKNGPVMNMRNFNISPRKSNKILKGSNNNIWRMYF
ncbi:hypothetical protein K502DRAFT_349747 [Neoconidiobolus thromboides FSU 785]|nr:hypothetical protein K502DRAFT_349747 [Neoconidiobolus thromboides FSU 785]